MKTLYLIGGTMGVGKSTVCQCLKYKLNNSVFLDGDWCWDANPFIVTQETKKMVLENICFLLNNFIHCSAYENIIFCWVMHQQDIIDDILQNLDLQNCKVKSISLVSNTKALRERLEKDIASGIRSESILEKSLGRIAFYSNLNTIKIDTSLQKPEETAEKIASLA